MPPGTDCIEVDFPAAQLYDHLNSRNAISRWPVADYRTKVFIVVDVHWIARIVSSNDCIGAGFLVFVSMTYSWLVVETVKADAAISSDSGTSLKSPFSSALCR